VRLGRAGLRGLPQVEDQEPEQREAEGQADLADSGTTSVGTLARRVGLSIATTSQHLAKLRLAGIVSARREGRHTYYTIEDPHVLTMIEQVFSHIAADGTLAADP